MKHKRIILTMVTLVIVATLITGCLPGNEDFEEKPAGFFAGLWHGLLCIITFVIGLFNENVHIYEVNNTGSLYDLGFLLGAMCALGGGGFGGGRRSRRGE